MFAKKTILAATALAALTAAGVGTAGAAPFDHHRGPAVIRHDIHRPYAPRTRVYETLRTHRYVGLGNPYFLHGRYVVRSHDRFGRVVLVEIDPWTGRYIGAVRI
jgi:hypothetical protein